MKILFLFIIIVVQFLPLCAAEVCSSGLTFKSYEVNKDRRTGLNLTPYNKIGLSDGAKIEFDFRLYTCQYNYGRVFRIIGDDDLHLDMVINDGGEKYNFLFGRANDTFENSEFLFLNDNNLNGWRAVAIAFSKGKITLSIDKQIVEIQDDRIDFVSGQILFGRGAKNQFHTTDVASITVKNIRITNHDVTSHYWEMLHNSGDRVYDSVSNAVAIVENGIWEIDKHVRWQKVVSLEVNHKNPQIAVDKYGNRLFVVYHHTISVVDILSGQINEIAVEGGNPYIGVASQLVYDRKNNKLLSYDLESRLISFFDFKSRKWSRSPKSDLLYYQHHNRIFNTEEGVLYTFGGYGVHKYYSDFLKWDIYKNNQSKKDLSKSISPRYLSSMGEYDSDHLVVIGGYGSITGKQEESPLNFYDAHSINRHTGDVTSLGRLQFGDGVNSHYTFGNSIVTSKTNSKLYTLAYNSDKYHTQLNLAMIDRDDFEVKFFRDSISYKFIDIRSYCDLFESCDGKMLYSIIVEPIGEDFSSVSMYSLNSPPMINRVGMVVEQSSYRTPILAVVLILLSILLILYIVIIKYKRKANLSCASVESGTELELPVVDGASVCSGESIEVIVSTPEIIPSNFSREKVSNEKAGVAIRLLGTFQIFDRDGADIASLLSPVMRQLFIYIYLQCVQSGKGARSQSMEDIFWFDLDHKKALNNMRVNISKLRNVLTSIDGISIYKSNEYWIIESGDDLHCDYTMVLRLLEESRNSKVGNKQRIQKIIELCGRGLFLSSINEEWADQFKSNFSWILIDTLSSAMVHSDIVDDFKLQVEIANIILMYDNIDENAIGIKCRALYVLGQKGLAHQTFKLFCANYQLLLNVDFDRDFNQIVQK